MRNILSTILISSLISTSVFAASERNIEKTVSLLGDLAMGYDVETVEGKNAHEMLTNYIKASDEESEVVFKEYEDMVQGDEIYEGFTSMKSALKMSEFAEAMIEEVIEHTDDEAEALKLKGKIYDLGHNWAPIIKRLDYKGVKFGYSGNGPGYCGVSFIKMLIIDEKEQKIYSVYLSESGPC